MDVTPLGTEDARILALETGPIRGHTMKVLIIDDAPPDDGAAVRALQAEVASRLPGVTRWRQRLVPAPASPTGMAWQDDLGLDITRHVRAACSARPIDDSELRRIAADIMVVPLDRDRPLWSLDVVPRLSDGRWAIVWKVHHALADGVTMMRAGSRLFWTQEARGGARASSPPAPDTRTTLLSYRGLVLREFRRVRALSPLAAEVGPDRAIAFARCPLDELRGLGKAVAPDVTINDVLLAVVTGALRRWLDAHEVARVRMKVQVPVSMHPSSGEEDPCGNRDSFLLVNLPLAEQDPVARVREVSRATRLRKNRRDARAIYALRDVLGRAPAPVRSALQRLAQGPQEYTLNVSNVPGPAGPVYVLGRRVDAMYSIAEIAPHHALRVSALSMGGWLHVGLCADPHVVPDLDALAEGIRLSIDELRERLR